MNKAAIVIPIYKKELLENEALSLLQCFNILRNYPIVFVGPKSLDTAVYEDLCKKNSINFKIERFQDKFFKGLVEYGRLLLNISFYKRFQNFDYMLLYQLDAWVFEDKLEYWCNQGYDYIGAPWFEGYGDPKPNAKMLTEAGNGGLSLRKIQSTIKVLSNNMHYLRDWKCIFETYRKNRISSNIFNIPNLIIKRYGPDNIAYFAFKNTKMYEDIFFVRFAKKLHKPFNVAPPEAAMHFSFEVNPSKLFEMTNQQLPFGCHAWEKYDPEFWSKFINLNP